jgi:CubicO group peptidase (beta-lactamase class C family)
MADLEHGVVNTPETIYEAGSVSKQFTAGAIVLLSMRGRLSLDDNVRKYVPEVPDYGTPITLRHLLTHTSGLRDWGNVAAISGWPRTTRVHTHDHVLDIVSRQSALNFTPGAEYSYCNTGFNLLAIIVSRVSGMSFADFCRQNIFEPLGMSHTQWRDDFKRIVKDRAIAFEPRREGGFEMDMPFENVHGNGGLLTTVGDLLLWTESLETGKLGGPPFLEAMHHQGRLNDGRTIAYASGLFVQSYKGIPEVSHTGSTAGYRAFLGRYPRQHVAVALLCNVGSVNPGALGHQIADIFLGDAVSGAAQTETQAVSLPADELKAKAGLYRNTVTGEPLRLIFVRESLRLQRGGPLVPISSSEFRVGEGERRLKFEPMPGNARPRIREIRGGDEEVLYEPIPEYAPGASELDALAGEYYSRDAETTLTAVAENGKLILLRRPKTRIELTPVYADVFEGADPLHPRCRRARHAVERQAGSRVRHEV